MTPRRILWTVGLLATSTAIFYNALSRDFMTLDSPSYIMPAQKLANGLGFRGENFMVGGLKVDAEGMPELFRTPGYPLLLALFFRLHLGIAGIIVLQKLLRIALIIGTTAFAHRISRSMMTAGFTGLLMSIDLPLLDAANSILAEMLAVSLLALAFWLLYQSSQSSNAKNKSLVWAALIAGAAVLVKPIVLFLFLPCSAFIFLVRETGKLKAIAIFCCCFSLLPFAWAVRNYLSTGYFTVSSVSAFSALQFKAAGALAAAMPGKYQMNVEAAQNSLESQLCAELTARTHRACAEESPQSMAALTQLARHTIANHPAGALKSTARGAALTMLDGDTDLLIRLTGVSGAVGFRALMLYTVPLAILALYGFIKLFRVNRPLAWLSVLAIAYFVVLSAGPESRARFRVPVVPIYVFVCSFAIQPTHPRWRMAQGCASK